MRLRTYVVPFSTKEEERLVFNLALKECMWLGCGLIAAALMAGVPAFIFQVSMPELLYLLPLAIPPMAVSGFMAFKKVKQLDNYVKVDVFLWNKWRFKNRTRDYIMYRRG